MCVLNVYVCSQSSPHLPHPPLSLPLPRPHLHLSAHLLSPDRIYPRTAPPQWHIGENNEWGKHTAMTRANRAPLLFAVPGGEAAVVGEGEGDGFAEFVDVFPTLADLAGIPVPAQCATAEMSRSSPNCTEGASLAAAVARVRARGREGESSSSISSDVDGVGGGPRGGSRSTDSGGAGTGSGGKKAAFGQWPKTVLGSKRMGYNVYTHVVDGAGRRWQARYTEWVKYDTSGDVHGPIWVDDVKGLNELYNRTGDPDENFNLANNEGMAEVVNALSAQLHAGWRAL